jgi:hypothetical protein
MSTNLSINIREKNDPETGWVNRRKIDGKDFRGIRRDDRGTVSGPHHKEYPSSDHPKKRLGAVP